jgi:hypothetical protein
MYKKGIPENIVHVKWMIDLYNGYEERGGRHRSMESQAAHGMEAL